MHRYTIIFALLISSISSNAQSQKSKLLSDIFAAEEDSLFQSVIQHPEIYRCQIIYTQINRERKIFLLLLTIILTMTHFSILTRLLQLKCRWHFYRLKK